MHPYFIAMVTALLLFTALSSAADNTDPAIQVEKLLQFSEQNTVSSGTFLQHRYLSGFDQTITSSGRFMYWKDHGLLWETSLPFYAATTYLKGKTINWSASGVISSEKKLGAVQSKVNEVLIAILSGNLEHVRKYFAVKIGRPSSPQYLWSIFLTPKNKKFEQQIKTLALHGGQHIETVDITSGSGDKTTIEFNDVSYPEQPESNDCTAFYPKPNHPNCN